MSLNFRDNQTDKKALLAKIRLIRPNKVLKLRNSLRKLEKKKEEKPLGTMQEI